MIRTKAIRAGAFALLTVTGFIAINAACEGFVPITACGEVDRLKLYDGIWILERINGSLLPTNDPTDASRRINAGSLTFSTERIYGSCDTPENSVGQVSGNVSYTQAGASTNRRAGGRFQGGHKSTPNSVGLASAEGTAAGSVAGSTMTFTNISDARFVLANRGNSTLVFRRF